MDEDLKIVLSTELEADEQASAQRISAQLPSIAKMVNAGSKIKIQVSLDDAKVQSEAQKITKQLGQIAKTHEVGVSVSLNQNSIRKIQAELKALDVNPDISRAMADQLDRMGVQVDKITGKWQEVAGAEEKLLNLSIHGTDQLGRTVSYLQTYSTATGEVDTQLTNVTLNLEKQRNIEEQIANRAKSDNEARIAYLTEQQTALQKIESTYLGLTSSKPVQDTGHLMSIFNSYDELQDKISGLMNAEGNLSKVQKAEIKSQMESLKELVREYQNAEYFANKLRTKDINAIKADQFSELDLVEKKLQSAGILTDEFKSRIDGLRTELQSLDGSNMVSFLNSFDKLNDDVSVFKEQLRGANALYTQIISVENKMASVQANMVKLDPTTDKGKLSVLQEQLKNYEAQKQALMAQATPYQNIIQYARQAEAAEQSRLENQSKVNLANAELADKAREVDEAMKHIPTTIASMQTRMNQLSLPTDSLVEQMQRLRDIAAEYSSDMGDQEKVSLYQKLETTLKGCSKEMSELARIQRSDISDSRFTSNLEKAKADLQVIKNQWSSLFTDNQLSAQFKTLKSGLENVSSSADLSKWTAQFGAFKSQVKAAGKDVQSFGDIIKTNIGKVAEWALATVSVFGVISRSISILKSAVSTIISLDSAMVDLRKTTNESDAAYQKFYSSASNTAARLGVTTDAIISQTAEWSRLGYTMEQAAKMAENSAIFTAISPEMSAEDATDGLISIVKAFGVEADDVLEGVISKINIIGNEMAVSNADIVEVMTRSSASMAAANNTFEETIALATAATEITRDASQAGNALRTISMRIRGYDEETEEYSGTIASLTGKVADLTKVASNNGRGISLFEPGDPDTYRSTYDILQDIADIWDELTDKNQAQLLEVLFGKNRAQVGAAILSNFDQAQVAIEKMENSLGNADAEMEAVKSSIEYKLNALQQTWVSVAQNLLPTELVGGIVDGANTASQVIDFLTKHLGLLGSSGALVASAGIVKLIGNFVSLRSSVSPVVESLQQIDLSKSTNGLTQYATQLSQLSPLQRDLAMSMLGMQNAQKSQVSAMIEATEATKQYTVAELEQAMSKKTGEIADKLKVSSTQMVTNETIKAGIAQGAFTEQELMNISTTNAQTAANYAGATSFTALGTSIKAAFAALMATPMGWITLLLGVLPMIISLVQDFAGRAEEARKELMEMGSEAAENGKKLSSLVSDYNNYKNAVDDGTGSQEEFISSQNALQEQLDLTGFKLDEAIKKYGSLHEAILGVASEQLNLDIATSSKGAKAAQEQAVADISGLGNGIINAYSETDQAVLDYLKDTGSQAEFQEAYVEKIRGYVVSHSNGYNLPNKITNNSTFEELWENYNIIREDASKAIERFGSDNTFVKALVAKSEEYETAMADAIEQTNNTNTLIAQKALMSVESIKDTPKTVEEMVEYRNEIISKLSNDSEFIGVTDGSSDAYVDYMLSQNDAYKDLWNQWQKETEHSEKIANDISSKMIAMTEKLFPTDSIEEDGYEKWSEQVDGFKEKLMDLSQDDFNIAFNAVIEDGASTWEEIEAAIRDYNSEQNVAIREAENLKKSINDLWESEDFKDSRKELVQMAKTIDGITPDAIKELASESDVLATILQEDGMNAEFLANILQQMALGGSGLEWITPELLALNDALEGMSSSFDEVSAAKARYDSVMSGPEKDDDFQTYASAFEELNKQFEAGTTNSNAFWAAAEFLFGEEQLNTWGWSDGLDQIYQAMMNLEGVFGDADSAGAGFIEKLYSMSEAGAMVNEEGEQLVSVFQNADGSWDIDFDPTNLDLIAEKMGMSREACLSCLEALQMWGDINLYDLDEVIPKLEDLGLAFENAGKKVFNVSGIADEMTKLGKSKKEIYDLTEMIGDLDNVVLLNVTGEVTDLIEGLEQLGAVSKDGVNIDVNLDNLSNLLSDMQMTKSDAEGLIQKLAEVDGITLTNAQGQVKSVQDAIDYVNKNADLRDAEEEVEDVGETADDTTGLVNNTSGAIKNLNRQSLGSINSQFDSFKTKANAARGAVYGVLTAVQALNNSGGVRGSVSSGLGAIAAVAKGVYAKGTRKASAGPSLVGDEYSPNGKPKPELVVTDGNAYLAGVHGPEIVNLDDGDQVYTADETKKILKSNKKIRISLPAYATGRFTGKGLHIETNKTGATGTAWGNSGNNSSTTINTNVNISTTADTKTLEEQLEETLKKLKEEIDDIIGDFEHDIFLMEKKGVSADEIVAVYKKMQAAVHEQANKYRKLGLAENSDYIQDLQKQWWEYKESIQETIVEAYESTIDNYKNKITLSENWIEMAIVDKNPGKVEQYSRDIVQYYKKMQKVAHEEAEYLRSQGYSDTSDEVSKLSDLWWDYENEIVEVKENVVNTIMDMVNNIDDAIDRLQDVYDTLHDAADEYKEYQGYISVDTFQKIKDLGLEYMQYLTDENGQLVINEENINKVIAAKTRQLAVENAMAYVDRLRLALNGESIEDLNQLLFATEETTNATWGLVYASLALLDLSDEQMEAALHNINAFRALGENAANGVGKAGETLTDQLKDMKSGIDDILKYVMDMLKQRIQNQIDALEDMKDAYSDIIDMKKKSLDATKEEEKYEKNKSKRLKEIAKLQARIDALSLDDSREAQAERAKLQEELAELQEDLADEQSDKAVDIQKDALDEMEEMYHTEKDKEIAILKDSISSYQKLYDMAIEYIKTNWDTLYSELIEWNTQYGSVLNSEITTAWNNALLAAQKYGDYVTALNNIQNDINNSNKGGGNSTNVVVGKPEGSVQPTDEENIHAIVKRMYANSQAWAASDNQKRIDMHEENKRLAAMLANYGLKVVTDGASWFLDKVGGPLLYDVYKKYRYHTGGIVGGGDIKSNEQISLLKEKEWVLSEQMVDNLVKQMDRISTLSKALDNLPTNMQDFLLTDVLDKNMKIQNNGANTVINIGDTIIQGNADSNTVSQHQKVSRDMLNQIARMLKIKV